MGSAKVYELDRLIECDIGNIAESKRALLALYPDSLTVADECAHLFEAIAVLFGKNCHYDDYRRQLDEWLKTRSGDARTYVNLLEQATLIGRPAGDDPVAVAKEALIKGCAVIARSCLLLRLGRDFLFGLSDLLRLRSTSMFGYLRVQTETAAILALANNDPVLAADWLNADQLKTGKAFFKQYHQRITSKIKELGLYRYYEDGSNVALHSRVSGVSAGVIIGDKGAGKDNIRLVYQEIDDHVILYLWYCVYLRAHKEIIGSLPQALPEIDFGQIDMSRLEKSVQQLWSSLVPLYKAKRNMGS